MADRPADARHEHFALARHYALPFAGPRSQLQATVQAISCVALLLLMVKSIQKLQEATP